MASKAERLARAAKARAILGLGDDDGPRTKGQDASLHAVVEQSKPGAKKRAEGRNTRDRGEPDRRSSADGAPAPRASDKAIRKPKRSKRAVQKGAPLDNDNQGEQKPRNELADGAGSPGSGVGQHNGADDGPPAFIDSRHWPKKHEHGSIKRGDSVWYCNQRYYVEWAPDHWSKGCYARLSNQKVHPDPLRPLPSDSPSQTLVSFCVHADALELAPVAAKPFQKDPTRAAIARMERARAGQKDTGDEVALTLREAKTIEDVYRIGAKYLGVKVQELKDRYGHLNPGQQRMNVGNKMRAHWRKHHA